MFRLIFRLLKLKLVQQELRDDRWDAGDRVGLVVRPARCPRRTRVGKLSIWLRVGSCVQAARRLSRRRRLRLALRLRVWGGTWRRN